MASSSSAHLLQQRIQTYYLHHKDKKERKKDKYDAEHGRDLCGAKFSLMFRVRQKEINSMDPLKQFCSTSLLYVILEEIFVSI